MNGESGFLDFFLSAFFVFIAKICKFAYVYCNAYPTVSHAGAFWYVTDKYSLIEWIHFSTSLSR